MITGGVGGNAGTVYGTANANDIALVSGTGHWPNYSIF